MYSRLVLAFALLGSTASARVISHNFDGPVSVCGDDYSCPFIDARYVPLFDPALGEFQNMSITLNVSGVALMGIGSGPWGGPILGEIPYTKDSRDMYFRLLFYSAQLGDPISEDWSVSIPRSSEIGEVWMGSAPVNRTLTYESFTRPTPDHEAPDPHFRLDIRMIGY